VINIRAVCCIALFCGSLCITPALAEATGQQRAQAAGRAILDASGEVFRAFRVNDVPTVLIADAHGRIVRRLEGSATQNAAALRTAVDSL
jgi:hypothetical protein